LPGRSCGGLAAQPDNPAATFDVNPRFGGQTGVDPTAIAERMLRKHLLYREERDRLRQENAQFKKQETPSFDPSQYGDGQGKYQPPDFGLLQHDRDQNQKARRQSPRSSQIYNRVCEDGHWIDAVLDDGRLIKLEDGSLWEIGPADVVTSSIWLPISDVIICGNRLINVDDNEAVNAHRIR